jgi:hypothetical protein
MENMLDELSRIQKAQERYIFRSGQKESQVDFEELERESSTLLEHANAVTEEHDNIQK